MKKVRKFGRFIPILVLVALLASLLPLAGVACSDDDEEAPVAAFSATPTSGAPPLSVTFTDSSTGEITMWEWNFGDGGTGTAQNPTYVYDAEGTYTVSLKVTGPGGTNTKTMTDYIQVGSFIADFSADKTTGTFEEGGSVTVQFTDQSTSLEGVTGWEWDFGDGETSAEQNPSHEYAGVVDRYDVSLTVTSAEGTKTTTKDGYITVHAAVYDSASLDLVYAMASGQTASRPADKFADLLQVYTKGRVNVTVFGGGILYTYGEDLTALKEGDADIVWTSPFFLKAINPCLDPFGGIPNMVVNYAMAREILYNTAIPSMISAALEPSAVMNAKLLGYIPSILAGLMAGKQDMGSTFAKDVWAGKKFGALYPGALAPEMAYAGLEEVVVGGANEITAAAQGLYDVSGTSPGHYVETGLIDYFPNALITVNFSPMVALFNMDSWNSLPKNTQDLITNIIVPECQKYGRDIALTDTAEVFRTIQEECDSVHIQTPVQGKAVYDNMVADNFGPMMDRIATFKSGFGGLGTQIYDIISALRPESPQWDQDFLDMCDYAGITVPSL